jgi:hypothetical protein
MILNLEVQKVHSNQLSQDKLMEFITSSNAIFSIKSLNTGIHFTFSVSCKKQEINDNPDFLFVSVLTGTDNTSNYTYLGYLKRHTSGFWYYTHGDKSKIGEDAKSNIAFKWIIDCLNAGKIMKDVLIWHEGVCCRCGRKLTAEKSSDNGIGDYCAKLKYKSRLKTA